MLPEGATSAFSSGSGIYGEQGKGGKHHIGSNTHMALKHSPPSACIPVHRPPAQPTYLPLPAGEWATSGEIDIAELRNQMQLVSCWCWCVCHQRIKLKGCNKVSHSPCPPPFLPQNIGSLHFGGQYNW